VKPAGAACTLSRDYCLFLKKKRLCPGNDFRLPDAGHEACIRQFLEADRMTGVPIAWQGGEPILKGLDFFRRSAGL